MASPTPRARPLSPHLSIWKPGPHMVVSILHRITGDGMATVGTVVLVWWLAAIAAGAKSYATFHFVFGEWAGGALGYLFGIGMTLCFFQHLATGVRHFVLDVGAGYELKVNRAGSLATMVFSVGMTVLVWAYILGFK
ncbi:succinate dehydrogenase, cytochrome b556 subunit [Sphingomonas sp. RB3P16]|uniref:succinate dehydrogenase, cytochrome b556 subunit n=1 Tax=Parasphingomonas frigoris TaxID=3096163 RepID=UPI002FC7207D